MTYNVKKSKMPKVDALTIDSIFVTGIGIRNAEIRIDFPNGYSMYTVVPQSKRYEAFIPPLARPLYVGDTLYVYQRETGKKESMKASVTIEM